MIKKMVNSDLPYVPWLTGYVAMAVGAILTFLLQSSIVFTYTLTPLARAGLVSL
jgi:sodium-dependent phosphate cotransporter